MLFEDAAHLRLQSLLSFSYNKDATSPQSGFDARAHFGKEGRILHIHDAAGEHHIETPLQPLAGEPAFEVVVVRNQVAEKTLLVHDAGIVVPEHRQRLEAGSHKRIAEPAVNHAPSPASQTADTAIPTDPAIVQQGDLRSKQPAQHHGQPTTGVFDTGEYKGHARASPKQERNNPRIEETFSIAVGQRHGFQNRLWMAPHLEGPETTLLVVLEINDLNSARELLVNALKNGFSPGSWNVAYDEVIHCS